MSFGNTAYYVPYLEIQKLYLYIKSSKNTCFLLPFLNFWNVTSNILSNQAFRRKELEHSDLDFFGDCGLYRISCLCLNLAHSNGCMLVWELFKAYLKSYPKIERIYLFKKKGFSIQLQRPFHCLVKEELWLENDDYSWTCLSLRYVAYIRFSGSFLTM